MDPRDPEHALRGDVAAHPAQVERPARRAGLQRRRHLQDDRRRARRGRTPTTGCPPPQFRGRIGIDIARSNPNVLYALRRQLRDRHAGAAPASAMPYGRPMPRRHVIKGAEIYRIGRQRRDVAPDEPSTEARRLHERATRGTYGWVFGQIRVDPTDENTIYIAGPRAQRVARRRQDVHAAARHARRPPRPVDRPGEPERSSTTQRRRLLS